MVDRSKVQDGTGRGGNDSLRCGCRGEKQKQQYDIPKYFCNPDSCDDDVDLKIICSMLNYGRLMKRLEIDANFQHWQPHKEKLHRALATTKWCCSEYQLTSLILTGPVDPSFSHSFYWIIKNILKAFLDTPRRINQCVIRFRIQGKRNFYSHFNQVEVFFADSSICRL